MIQSLKKITFIISLCIVAGMQGCTDENTIVVQGINSVYDPAVQPSVIFTYPSNNAVGPYTNLYNGEYAYSSAHFKIQFTKEMLPDHLHEEFIRISGFDEPVQLSYGSGYEPDGMYHFTIYRNVPGSYYPVSYRLGKKYTITVSGQLEDIHHQPLGKNYVFSFTMENTFRVLSTSPKDSISASTERVKLTFNSQIDSSILSKVSITPAIAGNWSITSNRRSIEFSNNTPFLPSTQYTVTLTSAAADRDGNALGVPFTLNFNSGIFRMVSSSPYDGQSAVLLSNGMAFNFNAVLSYSSIPGAFSISPPVKGNVSYGTSTIYFYPTEPLKEKTLYTVTIKNSLTSALGNTLSSASNISFTSEGFRLTKITPYPPYEISRYSSIELWFNTKIDTATARDGFTITPPVPGKITFSEDLTKIIVKPDSVLLPKTMYTIQFTNSMRSKGGYPLESYYENILTTGE